MYVYFCIGNGIIHNPLSSLPPLEYAIYTYMYYYYLY